ncbi:B12-binding domain-containing radical SAM protein [bacterium]|nr:B12-binding domain-containing radical SAM protein [bacterium]
MNVVFPYDGYEHLGISILAALAENSGHSVALAEIDIGNYIKGYRPLTLQQKSEAVEKVLTLKPDIVCFSLVSPTFQSMAMIARALKERGITTIAGGAHATALPRIALQDGRFDAVVCGEADSVFCEALERTVRNDITPDWLYGNNNPATTSPPLSNINDLPIPAKHLFYLDHPEMARDYLISTSRGCPFTCAFCAGARNNGSRVRQRSVDHVIKELEWAVRNYPVESVYFVDDVFTLSKPWLRKFLLDYSRWIDLPFHCITHPELMDGETAIILQKAGCFSIRLGVQTINPESRKMLNRLESNLTASEAIRAAKESGIRVEVDHIINIPNEHPEEIDETADFYLKNKPDAIKVYWFTPLPGSEWMRIASEKNLLTSEKIEEYSHGIGFGEHSYLFPSDKKSQQWLGVQFILAFLPHLPEWLIRYLVDKKIHRVLRIPSFTILVGLSRLINIIQGWDKVGFSHLSNYFQNLKLKH